MRTHRITAILALAAAIPCWVKGAEPPRVVTICMERAADFHMDRGADIQLFPLAQAMASKMFATAGVRIDWRGGRGCPSSAIFISVSADPYNRQSPGALAYALPYEGVHIMIFVDRVQKAIEPAGVPYVMAHVLVHEVTHILEGITRHSDSGVMKAEWTSRDYAQMYSTPLPFTTADIALIRSGVNRRNRSWGSGQCGATR